jgi:hypothetical protein
VGAAAGVLLALVACDQSDSADTDCGLWVVKGGLILGGLGGLAGLIIGAQFPKESTAPADSVSK